MAAEPGGVSGNIHVEGSGLDGNNHPTMTIFGVIDYYYDVQRATSANGTWGTLTTIQIPSTGKYQYTDTSVTLPPDGPFFYRTRPH